MRNSAAWHARRTRRRRREHFVIAPIAEEICTDRRPFFGESTTTGRRSGRIRVGPVKVGATTGRFCALGFDFADLRPYGRRIAWTMTERRATSWRHRDRSYADHGPERLQRSCRASVCVRAGAKALLALRSVRSDGRSRSGRQHDYRTRRAHRARPHMQLRQQLVGWSRFSVERREFLEGDDLTMANTVTCTNCGGSVYVGPVRQPVRCVEREASDYSPRSHLIIGGDWLLHHCTIATASTSLARPRR